LTRNHRDAPGRGPELVPPRGARDGPTTCSDRGLPGHRRRCRIPAARCRTGEVPLRTPALSAVWLSTAASRVEGWSAAGHIPVRLQPDDVLQGVAAHPRPCSWRRPRRATTRAIAFRVHGMNSLTGRGGANVEHTSDLNRRERASAASNCTAVTCMESVFPGQRTCRA